MSDKKFIKRSTVIVLVVAVLLITCFSLWVAYTDLPARKHIEKSYGKINVPSNLNLVKKAWYPRGSDNGISTMDYIYSSGDRNTTEIVSKLASELARTNYTADRPQNGEYSYANKTDNMHITYYLSNSQSNLDGPLSGPPYYVWVLASKENY